jgi:hypothetical protein
LSAAVPRLQRKLAWAAVACFLVLAAIVIAAMAASNLALPA